MALSPIVADEPRGTQMAEKVGVLYEESVTGRIANVPPLKIGTTTWPPPLVMELSNTPTASV